MTELTGKLGRHLSGRLVVPTHGSLTAHDDHPRLITGRWDRKSVGPSCRRTRRSGRTRRRVTDIGWGVGDCILQLGSALVKYQFVSLHLPLFPVNLEVEALGEKILQHGFELLLSSIRV